MTNADKLQKKKEGEYVVINKETLIDVLKALEGVKRKLQALLKD